MKETSKKKSESPDKKRKKKSKDKSSKEKSKDKSSEEKSPSKKTKRPNLEYELSEIKEEVEGENTSDLEQLVAIKKSRRTSRL